MRLRKGFEVEWCAGCPVDAESGDTDIDSADIRIEDFPDIKAARRFAKKKLKEDFFGQVTITPFELQPFEPGYPGLTREYIGQPEYITD